MGIINATKQLGGDLFSGKCGENFKKMSLGNKFKTVLKVAAIAALAGIIVGALGGFAGGALGTILGIGFAAFVGTASFAYFTSDSKLGENLAECCKNCVKTVKKSL